MRMADVEIPTYRERDRWGRYELAADGYPTTCKGVKTCHTRERKAANGRTRRTSECEKMSQFERCGHMTPSLKPIKATSRHLSQAARGIPTEETDLTNPPKLIKFLIQEENSVTLTKTFFVDP